jgi:tRNA threonylcarbamoyladenosine biosynthesis protein TsaB
MLILALDATSEAGGAAIYRDGECLASIAHEGAASGYSVSLFQMVDRLIAEVSRQANTPLHRLADIDLFAVTHGPGSFTGIRVGLAAAQAWAKAFGRPVKGLSVLEAMVEAVQPATGHALPILDAHRGEFYLGRFQKSCDSRFRPASEGWVLKPEALKAFVAAEVSVRLDLTCVVRAHDAAALSLRPQLPDRLEWQTVEGTLLPAIARLGHRAALEGNFDSPSQLDAYYIRRTDAELNLKE